jgi:putative FmdB family regulatory protein
MPIYEYECQECKQLFEEWQSGFEERELDCPVCGGTARRLISNTSFVLKGSGWYVTDYAGKNPSTGPEGGNGNGNGDGDGDAKAKDASPPADAKAAKREAAKQAACPGKAASGGDKANTTAS